MWLCGFGDRKGIQETFEVGVAVILDDRGGRIVAEEWCLSKRGEMAVMKPDAGVIPVAGRVGDECCGEILEGRAVGRGVT